MAAADITVTTSDDHHWLQPPIGKSLSQWYYVWLRMRNALVYMSLVNLATVEERHIIQTYRLNRVTIMELVAQLEPDLVPAIHNPNVIPPTVQMFLVLHYLVSGSFQVTVGPASGMSKPMFSSVLRDVVCLADQYISQVRAKCPGSVHDSYILQNSSIPHMMAQLHRDQVWLIGDSGYPNLPWLLAPVRRPTSAAEDSYKEAHGCTRWVIERCFGLLKDRFRCLYVSRSALLYNPQKVCQIIVACCMLHNLALRRHIPLLDAKEGVAVLVADEGDMGTDEKEDDEDAADSRAELIRHYFD
ncbi:putative nuclease HARBI1 [Pleurodeles waltl]|uniref:putative nuclease HARBI1 n=1 Tax=Pleurodeles waltl TaxID=8319 RepID=UPI0037099806